MALQVEELLPPALAPLKNVDALLRCPICFDFLSISMMTKCSHNFCSLCIRKFLSYKLQCPVCNLQVTEQDLRTNRLLDELVVNFQAARNQLSKANLDTPPKTPASAVKCKSPIERSQKCNSVLSHYFQKKPKTSPSKDTRRHSSVVQRAKIEMTPRTHSANRADLHLQSAQPPLAVKEEPMDEEEEAEVEAGTRGPTAGERGSAVSSPPSRQCKSEPSSPSEDMKPVVKVECPVCSVGVSQHFINKHLDTCLSSGEKKDSLRSSLGSGRRPMGKLVYNLLSLQELKRRLKGCSLSLQGSRDQLIKRHQEFVHIYNAQCDSLNPRTAEDIAKEVEGNEKIRNQLQAKSKPVMVFSKNQPEEEIDTIHSNYRKKHSTDFSRLVAQVRGRLNTSRHTRIKQEVTDNEDDAHKTHSTDQLPQSNSCLSVKLEDTDSSPSAEVISIWSSPAHSDVSISRDTAAATSSHKRSHSSRRGGGAASPPILGKRRRKT
ncbi:E3 ubiquitin-protein ligase RAD18 isoform X2 [Genypterus blacodes]|uniref:E3 ubiquitin-protein ligase RAD18 isoform X2 n=1 Tax=Genypterus blacodes TaxID=154954 RepID=UPI003F75F63B